MSRILVTGATGNIGISLIHYLSKQNNSNTIVVGVRTIEKAKLLFVDYPEVEFVHFDYEDFETHEDALNRIDRVFLLRPPHISDVEKYFRPLISMIKEKQIHEIVFLSVQGADASKVIPHNKIERLIVEYGFDFVFLRPSYFMQNLTTTLLGDIRTKRAIVLPSGSSKFNWIDIENIGEAAAIVLDRFEAFKNQSFDITGLENENFENVVSMINARIESPINFFNVNPFLFYKIKKKEGMAKGMILVLILLHFLPRFQKVPRISDFYERITGDKPTDLQTFIEREKAKFQLQN